MKKNHSPWLYQLKKDRQTTTLKRDESADVVIVGAGIAGVSTAFFTLRDTDKTVILVEGGKLAHGATGHNAGQLASYMERPFHHIVEEFGLKKACEGQLAIESAWKLIDEMYTYAGLNVPLSRFNGHAGLSELDQVLEHLKNNVYRKAGGLNTEQIFISEKALFANAIPEEYKDFYSIVPHEVITQILETKDSHFVATLSYQKGCLNSALFSEEIVEFLIKTYPTRFQFFEHTPIKKVVLKSDHALLDADNHVITASRVVLCTNGFENFTLINVTGLDINTKFHHLVRGKVGYMSGYIEKYTKPPTAISYFADFEFDEDEPTGEPYYYLTRRMYDYDGMSGYNLISIGGPEFELDNADRYSSEFDYPDDAQKNIDAFVRRIYNFDQEKKINYQFTWHGLMGYTRNGIRLIGIEPKNPVLLYNLGCNGVGILPSIYGAHRISRLINNETLEESIFDVPKSL